MLFLVGGMGTRLGARSANLPKPMQPVAGKPFIRHLIEDARRYGIARFLLLAGHLGHIVVEEFAKDGDVEVLIEPTPMGTGGALRFAGRALDDTFLMSNGDSFFRFNLLDLARPPESTDWLAKLALRGVEDADRYGVVECAGARVTGFRERGEGGRGVINGGVYLLRRAIVDEIGEGAVSLERDVFPRLAARDLLYGAAYEGPFIDIGIPDALDHAQSYVPAMLRAPALLLSAALAQDAAAVKRVNDAGLYAYAETSDLTGLNARLRPAGAHLDGAANSLDEIQNPLVDRAKSVRVHDADALSAALSA